MGLTKPTVTMDMRGRPVTLAEAKESARRMINSHFRNPDGARVSIPANVCDDDIVLSDFLHQLEVADAQAQG